MSAKVRIPTPLRKLTNNEELVEVNADSVGAAIVELQSRYPGIKERLLDDKGRPYFDLSYYAVTKDGRYAGSSAYEGGQFAVADATGPRLESTVFLFKRDERPRAR